MAKKKKGRKNRRYQKDQLMNRMKKSQQQQEGGMGVLKENVDVTIWRPKDGDHTIDIIPYKVGKHNVDGDKPGSVHYTYRYFMHRNIGPANKWVICPLKTYGKDCPVCEHRQKLIDKGSDWDKYVKPLFPKERYLYNVVVFDRGQEKKGVQIWDVSNHYFQKHIIKLSKRPTRGGRDEKQILFFDEQEGKSIQFTIEPAQSKDDFPEYIGHAFEERDYIIDDEILDSAHCLDELVSLFSYKEIKDMYGGGKSTKSSDDDDDDDDDGENNWEMLIDDLDEVEDNEELVEFCEDNDVSCKIKSGKKKFKANKKKVRSWLEEQSEAQSTVDDDDDDDEEMGKDDLIEALEDIEDQEELDDFCEENDVEVKMKKKKFKLNLKKVRSWIEENVDDGDDEDDDEDDDDEPDFDIEDIEEMSKKELKALIKEEDLDVDVKKIKKFVKLRQAVIEELGLDDD